MPTIDVDRAALLERWLDLTKRLLPAAATARAWPIRADHCFMRVCLDATYRRPWHTAINRPAIRHIGTDELRRAVAIAERLLDGTADLAALNRRSIAGRAAHERNARRGGIRRADGVSTSGLV